MKDFQFCKPVTSTRKSGKRKVLTGTTRHPLNAYPPQGEHGRVMINVKEAQLIVLLSKYEEKCITELEQFAEVVPPHRVRDLAE